LEGALAALGDFFPFWRLLIAKGVFLKNKRPPPAMF
jgi:hypothetical protein